MPSNFRRTLPLALGLIALGPLGSTAWAQGNVFNPFGNSGYQDYREFGNPVYATNPALPGQSALNNRPIAGQSRANTFQDYTDELDALSGDPAASRRITSSLPYYEASRIESARRNRGYRPNEAADREFNQRMKEREAAYDRAMADRARAMAERDPVKRSRMLREVEQRIREIEQRNVARAPSPAARSSASAAKPNAPARPDAAASASRPSASAPGSSSAPAAPGRTPAPERYAPDASRRTSPAPDPSAPTSRSRPPSTPSPSGTAPDPSAIPTPAPPR